MKKLTIILILLSFSAFGDEKELSNTEIQDLKRQEAEQYAEKHRLAELKYNKNKSKHIVSAADYFLPKPNTIYHYKRLKTLPNSTKKGSLFACGKQKNIDTRIYVYCERITFIGDSEVKNSFAYKITPDRIILDKLGFYSTIRTVMSIPFLLPKNNLKSRWLKNDADESECTSSFLIRKDHQPNTENPLKSNLRGVIVKHLP